MKKHNNNSKLHNVTECKHFLLKKLFNDNRREKRKETLRVRYICQMNVKNKSRNVR